MSWIQTLFYICVFAVSIPVIAHAQLALPGNTAQLTTQPQFPTANQLVTVTINDYSFDSTAATINWERDGIVETSFRNKRSYSFTTGDLGTQHTIIARITLPNGQTIPAVTTLSIGDVSVILDSNGLTPLFYLGRALPSSGSTIKATAIPNIGTNTSPSDFTYTWKLNNRVLGGGAATGAYNAVFNMPDKRDNYLQVDVSNANGTTIARKSILIPKTEPELLFYVDNPLRGLSRQAIVGTLPLIGDEVSVRGEPYHLGSNIFAGEFLDEWQVDSQTIENPNTDQQVITLQNGGGIGIFSITYHIRNLNRLQQGIEDNFNIQF